MTDLNTNNLFSKQGKLFKSRLILLKDTLTSSSLLVPTLNCSENEVRKYLSFIPVWIKIHKNCKLDYKNVSIAWYDRYVKFSKLGIQVCIFTALSEIYGLYT